MNNKTLLLNLSERYYCIALLNEFKGPSSSLALIFDDLKLLVITEEEWEKAGRKIAEDESGNAISASWDNEKGGDKSIDLTNEATSYLRGVLNEKDQKGEFTLKDVHLASLYEKLK